MGDFNELSSSEEISSLISVHGLYSLIHSPTCFKTPGGRCIDLILTNRKFNFQKSTSFETGVSDHHHLIYTILKTKAVHTTPKTIHYRSYKNFDSEYFLNDLRYNLKFLPPGDFNTFYYMISSLLDSYAPMKKKVLRGNQKPYFNKDLSKAIMERSRLKNIANKSRKPENYIKYKRLRNYVCNLNKKSRRLFFENLSSTSEGTRNFWKECKPLFSKISDNHEEKSF